METRHQLRGIELRYALTMYLLQHGPTTVDELIKALEWQGFEIRGRPNRCRTHCVGNGGAAGSVDLHAGFTVRGLYHAARSTGYIPE
jgi:hypothetical protein